ncbi:kynurenine 3-monooxygenase [Condylostylus longicornis]|uniref:kynurenine 3-monooxygenase n=1 Tax=Condylostylus longicornis TaxID=2530218 RepID=UPI00244E36AF|nr:kynurenine 3-monooxygenase [Condylostylus longicornis]
MNKKSNGIVKQDVNVAIIGGGLVGSLTSLFLAKLNYNVNIYEYREDIRKVEQAKGRSINLALSVRGFKALEEVGLKDVLLKHGIPMKGRMLHDLNGQTTFVPYDSVTNQCIYSIGRKFLNEVLLTAGEKYTNIKRNFKQKLISANLKDGSLKFRNCENNEEYTKQADLVIGCDGAYSQVRRNMLNSPGFNFSQTYIEHGYIELCIPAENNEFAIPANYLHVWPRGKFMMIALPNQDKSWTVTLFMPFHKFESIKNEKNLLEFFNQYFPDAIPLIGEERLIKDFFNAIPQHLVSIKCYPYNVSSKALLLGDAAHAMVPFYGQGMNAGFEDCTILYEILCRTNKDLEGAITEFSETRWENAHAICDLAMYNYVEMRDLVTKRSFLLRKKLDTILYQIFPQTWIPLYNSVSFTSMQYKKCIENRKWQDTVLRRTFFILVSGITAVCFAYFAFLKFL